jgi:hypothetical protein
MKIFRSREHDDGICSRGYFGFSKGMEAHGALESVTYLHQKHDVIMEYIVMDNDSSSKNMLHIGIMK